MRFRDSGRMLCVNAHAVNATFRASADSRAFAWRRRSWREKLTKRRAEKVSDTRRNPLDHESGARRARDYGQRSPCARG